jgi:hypothetical protein
MAPPVFAIIRTAISDDWRRYSFPIYRYRLSRPHAGQSGVISLSARQVLGAAQEDRARLDVLCRQLAALVRIARSHAHARTHARTHTRTQVHTHTRTRTHTHTHTHARTRTRAHARTLRAGTRLTSPTCRSCTGTRPAGTTSQVRAWLAYPATTPRVPHRALLQCREVRAVWCVVRRAVLACARKHQPRRRHALQDQNGGAGAVAREYPRVPASTRKYPRVPASTRAVPPCRTRSSCRTRRSKRSSPPRAGRSSRWAGGRARAREYSRVPSTPPERAVPFEWRRIVKTKGARGRGAPGPRQPCVPPCTAQCRDGCPCPSMPRSAPARPPRVSRAGHKWESG